LSLLFFFLVLAGIYWSDLPERRRVRFSFWLVPTAAVFGVYFLESPWNFLVVIISLIAFFIVLALSSPFFKNQFIFYDILNTVIIFALTALYIMNAESYGIWVHFLFFAVLAGLFSETFNFFGFIAKKRKILSALIMSIIALEIARTLSFLPLGILNSAVYLTLILILIRDGLVVYRGGFLSLNFFLREFIFLIVFTIIIFAASSWEI